jgi:signal peptidase I
MSMGKASLFAEVWSWTILRAADKQRTGSSTAKPAGSSEKSSLGEQSDADKPAAKHSDALRETVESVVIAFVLAFLFRTFLAEAFVIPTGSMAPTLMGRHKDFACTQCGHHYTVGASDEVEKESSLLTGRMKTSVCPNCNYTNDVFNANVFNGDRILVNKFPYEFGEPDRFDVFVFRYPEDPQTNYIKRLVGLPGESLKIDRGDLYARKGSSGEFEILRKADPYKQKLLQQTVYDDTHPPSLLLKHGWPERWAAMQTNLDNSPGPEWLPDEQSWTQDTARRSFEISAGDDWKWLRYRHLPATDQDWERAVDGQPLAANQQPQLISDFCGYNAHRGRYVISSSNWTPDALWVGDLTLHATVNVRKAPTENARLMLELVEGVRRYRCEFDLATGTVTLSRIDDLKGDGSYVTLATSPAGIKGSGRHHVIFANVDHRLCLWIDGSLIPFGKDAEYPSAAVPDPQIADLHPVGIAARNVDVDVSGLKIERDIYYRALKGSDPSEGEDHDMDRHAPLGERLAKVLDDPAAYNEIYNKKSRAVEFDPLDDDEFFAMGDNSSRSYDGRLWHKTLQSRHPHAVNRRALIGKAFFVYWPHGVPFLNDGKGFPVMMHATPKPPPVENYPLHAAPFYPQWWRWSRIR